jgi:hypothetical protein
VSNGKGDKNTLNADRCRVIELLARYLLASNSPARPGTDGFTIDDVVDTEYLVEAYAGQVPLPRELIRRHPALAAAILEFFLRPHCRSDRMAPLARTDDPPDVRTEGE